MTNSTIFSKEILEYTLGGKSSCTILLPHPIKISNLLIEVSWNIDEINRPFSFCIDYFESIKKVERIYYVISCNQNNKMSIRMPLTNKLNNLWCRNIELRIAGQQALFLTNFYIRVEDLGNL